MTNIDTADMVQQPLPLPHSGPRLIPVTKWPQFHPWPTVSALRHLRFHCRDNGFAAAFVTVRGRVLVDEAKFFEICREQGEQS